MTLVITRKSIAKLVLNRSEIQGCLIFVEDVLVAIVVIGSYPITFTKMFKIISIVERMTPRTCSDIWVTSERCNFI